MGFYRVDQASEKAKISEKASEKEQSDFHRAMEFLQADFSNAGASRDIAQEILGWHLQGHSGKNAREPGLAQCCFLRSEFSVFERKIGIEK